MTLLWPGQFIHAAEHKPVRPHKCVRAIIGAGIIVVAVHLAAIGADRASKNISQVTSKRVGSQELHTMMKSLGQAGLQSVVPSKTGGPDIEHAASRESLIGHALLDICNGRVASHERGLVNRVPNQHVSGTHSG